MPNNFFSAGVQAMAGTNSANNFVPTKLKRKSKFKRTQKDRDNFVCSLFFL